jgi:hypothetical protein
MVASAAGPIAWNAILRATHASQFFTDAPVAVLPASWQDTGSGVFAFTATAVLLGVGPLADAPDDARSGWRCCAGWPRSWSTSTCTNQRGRRSPTIARIPPPAPRWSKPCGNRRKGLALCGKLGSDLGRHHRLSGADSHSFAAIPRGEAVVSVHRLRVGPAGPTLAEAIAGYLATLDHPETAGTRRVYGGILAALRDALGADLPVAELGQPAVAERLTGWFTGHWALERRRRSTATWTRCAPRSATGTTRAGWTLCAAATSRPTSASWSGLAAVAPPWLGG